MSAANFPVLQPRFERIDSSMRDPLIRFSPALRTPRPQARRDARVGGATFGTFRISAEHRPTINFVNFAAARSHTARRDMALHPKTFTTFVTIRTDAASVAFRLTRLAFAANPG